MWKIRLIKYLPIIISIAVVVCLGGANHDLYALETA